MKKQDLINLIISKIYSNNNNEISGDILQRVLIEIVNNCYETNIVQSEGQSKEYVMSQKAVTDVFKAIRKSIEDNLLLKVDKTTKINGHTLDKDVELTPNDIWAALEEELKENNTNFKGYWSSFEDIGLYYPSGLNQKGWFAWVGTPYPGEAHEVLVDGADWSNTGKIPTV